MSINEQKFLATANGKQIRLFPWNYGVLAREESGAWDWKLNIDVAIPEELAVEIFRAFHTNHELRWGDKQVALDALNALVDPSKPDFTWPPGFESAG